MPSTTTTTGAPGAFPGEAEVTDDGIRAARDTLAEKLEWLRLPPVSGAECVHALVREGFVVLFASSAFADLKRHDAIIQVPLVEILQPEVLTIILQRANIGPGRFMGLLDD